MLIPAMGGTFVSDMAGTFESDTGGGGYIYSTAINSSESLSPKCLCGHH